MRIKRYIIIGSGAIGGSLGALLCEAEQAIILIARGEHGRILQSQGITLHLPDRSLEVQAKTLLDIDQVTWQSGDLAILATKLNDTEATLDRLLKGAGPDLPIACAQNGLQGEVWAAARFHTVLSMLVWMPAVHLEPGQVALHTLACRGVLDTGPHRGGPGMEIATELCAQLRAIGFDAKPRADIGRWKTAKWITNLGGAAQAMVTDDWQRVAEAAQAEGERILTAAGSDRVSTVELRQRVAVVHEAPINGKLRPGGSTWQSRERGKDLETPWLEGAMAELAAKIGYPAPINRFLATAAITPRPLTADEVLEASA